MAAITTGSWAKALYPGLNAIFGLKYNEWKAEWPEIFDKYTDNRAFVEELSGTGFGMAQVKNEGAPITYDTMEQGFVFRYTHVTYALGFIVTREMYLDNLYTEIGLKRAESLAFSLRQSKETVTANVLNRAFNSSYTGGDGKELCSTIHPNKSGGTYSNEIATAADISEASLEQACIDIAALTNDRGMKIKILPKKILIHPNEEFNVARILKSINQSGTANNDINAIRVLGKFPDGYRVNHYFTDTDAWFIKTDAPHGMKLFQREKMTFDQDNDTDTTNAKFIAYERFSAGWSDPRGLYGSPGA